MRSGRDSAAAPSSIGTASPTSSSGSNGRRGGSSPKSDGCRAEGVPNPRNEGRTLLEGEARTMSDAWVLRVQTGKWWMLIVGVSSLRRPRAVAVVLIEQRRSLASRLTLQAWKKSSMGGSIGGTGAAEYGASRGRKERSCFSCGLAPSLTVPDEIL